MSHLFLREEEILSLLKVLHSSNLECVVVGGYAVDSYSVHRYSVDLDLIVSKGRLQEVESLLRVEGYSLKSRSRPMNQHVKKISGYNVSVELFVGKLTCRQTGGSWSYGFARRNAASRRIVGMTGFAQSLVPRRELLMAMKLHSRRAPDLRDVVMLSKGADWGAVERFAECGSKEKVLRQLDSATKIISEEKFMAGLRSEFSMGSSVPTPIARTVAGITRVKHHIAES